MDTNSPNSYWQQSRLPLTSLIFVTPLLAVYDGGLVALGTGEVSAYARNGVDIWLRQLLKALGFGQYFLLPVLTVCLLLGWHFTLRQRWRFSVGVLSGMLLESIVLAVVLWQAARWRVVVFDVTPPTEVPLLTRLVAFLGAGIYEELLFRLMMLPAVAIVVAKVTRSRPTGLAVAVVVTSLAFAAAHHLPGSEEPFTPEAFVFRSLAGGFFALVFALRGFGIVVGVHAAYDVLVGIVFA